MDLLVNLSKLHNPIMRSTFMPMPVPYRSGIKTSTNTSALVVVEGGMGLVAAQYLAGDLVTVLKAMISASNLFAATVSRRWRTGRGGTGAAGSRKATVIQSIVAALGKTCQHK